MNNERYLPLISVIIPTYNYSQFLPRAINSVLQQTYNHVEIIIIDDGSTDDTANVIKDYSFVQYYYQPNKGLAAARNNGIQKSKGEYLVFLDADDWLQKDALMNNYDVLKNQPELAFVSGNHYFLRAETNELYPVSVDVHCNHYMHLLQCNYIGMHAAVMFQCWVFKQFKYDENLKACEDYDLYLNIARKYPIKHHDKFIATYYFHSSGLSHNYEAMMHSVKAVIKKQSPHINTNEEKLAYEQGLEQWKDYSELLKASLQL